MARIACVVGWLGTFIALAIAALPARADDGPVIRIVNGRLEPRSLSVHVGEVVRWQPSGGGAIRVELDRHPTAHEVAERSGEVHAVFRKKGQHDYVVTIVSTGERLPGIVTVEDSGNAPPSLECASGSSDRICFMP